MQENNDHENSTSVDPIVMRPKWDIRLQCVVCGWRSRRSRNDGNPPFGNEPQATFETVCYNCDANNGYPIPETVTIHFVDYATDDEMNDPKYA